MGQRLGTTALVKSDCFRTCYHLFYRNLAGQNAHAGPTRGAAETTGRTPMETANIEEDNAAWRFSNLRLRGSMPLSLIVEDNVS